MKICIWVTQIFSLGGTKRVVTLLANELVKQHDVTIMCYQDRFREDRTMYHMSEDIKVDFIDNNEFVNRHWTPAFGERFAVKKLNEKTGCFNRKGFNHLLADALFPKKTQDKWVEYLNAQNYDVIITTASLSLKLAMIADRLTAKTVGWQHNCYDGYVNVPGVVFWKQECLLQEYLPKLDRYIVLSEYDRRDYQEKLGIDTEVKINPRSFVSEKKCDPDSRHFLMATRFVYAKGLDLMMESFEEFCKQDSEWTLDILGDGELFKEIVADAKKRGLEKRVRFVGYTNEPEKYYLNSSVFLLPSRWEGWPMVIMEAFEFGLPVIAYHMGAMDLIIDDGKTGLLPEAFDTHQFTEAMLRLAHDDELRLAMHRNAIAKSGDFAIEKAVQEWNGLFIRLTGIPVEPVEAGNSADGTAGNFADGTAGNSANGMAGNPADGTAGNPGILGNSGGAPGAQSQRGGAEQDFSWSRLPEYGKAYAEAKEDCRLNLNEELRAKYAEFLETKPLDDHMILYEAFGGRGMTCSPHAIFQYLLGRPEFADFVHVWVIDDFEDNRLVMQRYQGMENVRFVKHQSLEYREYLATAKYLINNVSFPGYFTKREGQVYVDTWHGIPLKTIGFDIPTGNVSNGNSAKNLLAADYLISPNPFMTEIYKKAFKLEGLYPGTILEVGQPRNDNYFHAGRAEVMKKLSECGVKVDPAKKLILYAPTWKGSKYASPDTGLETYYEIIRRIEANVDLAKYQILVKPHQIVYYHIKKTVGITDQFIPATVDTNELLAVTDVLISDYSSIYFDFLVSGKPILFFIPDLDEYTNSRGLYFGIDKLPGPIAKTYEELEVLVRDPERAMEPCREKYAQEAAWACPKDDGEVCRRVAEAVFGKQGKTADSEKNADFEKMADLEKTSDSERVAERANGSTGEKLSAGSDDYSGFAVRCGDSEKKRILLYPGSFIASGRTFSFLELAEHLDYEKYDVTAVVEAAETEEEEQRILGLPKPLRVLYRGQPSCGTPREKALDVLAEQGKGILAAHISTERGGNLSDGEELERYYRREFRRMFGESCFDCAVDLSAGDTLVSRMISQLFSAESGFDVSERGTAEDGEHRCCAAFSFDSRVPDLTRIQKQAENPEILHTAAGSLVVTDDVPDGNVRRLKVLPLPEEGCENYLTMGRLVKEKQFDLLLENFAAYYPKHPKAHLYLLGDGPERKALEELVQTKNLKEAVTFTGFVNCPFGLLKACGAYMKAPGHRENSMGILEAQALGIPVYSPDFSGKLSLENKEAAEILEKLESKIASALESESVRCRHE